MYLKTVQQRLDNRREVRDVAQDYFWSKLVRQEGGLCTYYYMKYVSTTMMVCKDLESFIRCCLSSREDAVKTLGISEDFDWVWHCIESGKLHAGKGEGRLTQYNWIHCNSVIYKYYLNKVIASLESITE